jgi:hypothetical protein
MYIRSIAILSRTVKENFQGNDEFAPSGAVNGRAKLRSCIFNILIPNPNVAKAGGLQSQAPIERKRQSQD